MPANNKKELGFKLLIIYLIFDYARPHQVFFPLLAKLHPGYILHLSLLWCLYKGGYLSRFPNTQAKAFFALVILMMLHVPFAVNNYAAYMGWRNTFLSFVVFLSIVSFIDDIKKLESFFNLWIKLMILCALIGIRYGGKVPHSSFMGDENDFALVMNMAIALSYFLYFYENNPKRRKLYLFSIPLFLLAVIRSFSRGGFVGLAGTTFYIWIRNPHKVKTILVFAIFAILFYIFAPSSYWKEIETLKQEGLHKGTAGARWYSWKCGMKMFLDHPIFGVGQNNFNWNFPKYEPKEEWERYRGRLHGGRSAHSLYVTVLTELGIVGTYLYFLIFFKSRKELFLALKKIKDIEDLSRFKYLAYGLESSLIGYFFSGAFLTVCYYPHYWVFNSLMIATAHILNSLKKEK